ncbi:MAG: hypothetical protein KDB69_06225, partial [Acidimicrobiia bacterium]|nr:hypothetical protein [Acidimicrobiia bacterium]
MLESVESLTGSARTRQLLLATVAACVFAWLYTYVVSQIDVSSSLRTGLMSDLNAYARLTDQVLDGGWPYFDVVVEHLPISTAALLVLVSFSSWSGIALWVVWPVAMAALVVLTA